MTDFTLGHIADLVGGEVQGDKTSCINVVLPLDKAEKGSISFLGNTKYKKHLSATRATAVLLKKEHVSLCPTNAIIVNEPYLALVKVATLFEKVSSGSLGIHTSAIISDSATVSESASIGPKVVIGDDVTISDGVTIGAGSVIEEGASIGANTRVRANVTIYHGVRIGQDCVLHSGCVIGADGFGNVKTDNGWVHMPQLGTVRIGNNVEIGANTAIDRGTLGDTILKDGVRIDNLVQIAHNVEIGENTAIAACSGIAGSVIIGKNCLLAGASLVSGHLTISDNVIITAMSGVPNDIKEPGVYSAGLLIQKNRDWRKNVARYKQLDSIARRLIKLEKSLEKETEEL